MWKEQKIDLGNILSGKAATATFQYLGDKKIQNATASCGCTIPELNKEKATIKAAYTPKATKMSERSRKDTKRITVRFDDGSEDVLELTATTWNSLP